MASTDKGKLEIVQWIHNHVPRGSTCLDVGACDGKWADLLRNWLRLDGVEIYAPNIWRNNLTDKYRMVFGDDIEEYKYNWYDLIIFGDVIEHMDVEKAQRVLEYAKSRCHDMIIGVPYKYQQGALYGNPYEVHIQDDLTEEIFCSRYPGYEKIWACYDYAYWHKTK